MSKCLVENILYLHALLVHTGYLDENQRACNRIENAKPYLLILIKVQELETFKTCKHTHYHIMYVSQLGNYTYPVS